MPHQQNLVLSQEQLEVLLARAVASGSASNPALSEKDLEHLVSRAIQRAFVAIGIATDDPINMQQDFSFLRSLRTSTQRIKWQGVTAIVGATITAIIGMIVVGFRSYFGHDSGSK